ncbi:ABC transporter substrate-binding protein [Paenibacillus sp. A3]|uniref:extracellular solute-binding protein n=1 Tax=Paenibacillus sp. A3 TaxID=1337054 RepID=UPI0006D53203|nr:extracellular solute-binding protein [Paenibacillus sp. A3]KPV60397.1 ABC transporter substrate-binding protein [Paenibacillus sp. A3]
MKVSGKRWKQISSLALVTALVAVTGCGDKSGGTGKEGASSGDSGKKQKISMMYPLYGNPPQKTEVWKKMEEAVGIEYESMAIPSAQYPEKLKASIAANSLPDITHYMSFPDPNFTQYAKQGAFLQLDDYIKDTKHLKNMPQSMWDFIKIDGKTYGIPRPAQMERAVVIRKDWLDNLGLPIPKTLDEFYQTAVKFAKGDPDKNGKEDTVGIVLNQTLGYHLDPVFMAFDTGNGWRKMEDGTLMNAAITPQRKEALMWLGKLYKDGGIDKNFTVMKDNQMWETLESGKAGIFFGAQTSDYSRFVTNLKKVDPKVELIMIAPPVGKDGKTGFPDGVGMFGQFVLPANISKEKAKKAIELLDWQAGQEAHVLRKLGVEGVHHKKNADGTVEMLGDKYAQDGIAYLIWNVPNDPLVSVPLSAPKDIQEAVKNNLTVVSKLGVVSPAVAYMPSTNVSKNFADLDQLARGLSVKMVIGEATDKDFDKFAAEWNKRGGEAWTKEVNEWYKQQQK